MILRLDPPLFLAKMILQEFPWSLLFLAIAATAALATAVLNYLSRPILVRTIEKHSNALKEIAEEWLNKIPQPPEPDGARERITSKGIQPLQLDIENEFLFLDLKEHMPPGMNLLQTWSDFKKAYDRYNSEREALFNHIRKDVEVGTRLSLVKPPLHTNHGIDESLIHAIYSDVFKVLRGREPEYQRVDEVRPSGEMFELWHGGDGLARGTNEEISRVKDFVNNMAEKLKESPYLSRAKKICEQRYQLAERRENLARDIRGFRAIPIVPGRCNYIRQSVSSPLDKFLKRLDR